MNCQEYRDKIEDALDVSLHGELKAHVCRHLEHCEDCRAYFAARSSEHVALFTSVNAAYSHLHPPPPDFVDRLMREVESRRAVRRGWRRLALPRWALIAASVLVMAGFVFAAAVATGVLPSAATGDAATAAASGAVSSEEPVAAYAAGSEAAASVSPVASGTDAPSIHSTTQTKGESPMNKGKAAAAALTAAIAASPLAEANGDDYRFIISGELVATTAGCSAGASETAALTSGTLADGIVCASSLEGRYRTADESAPGALRSDECRGVIISIK